MRMTTKQTVRVDLYEIVSRAVEEGVGHGVRRALKHTDTPEHESIEREVGMSVMNALCEVIEFGED